MYESFDPFEVLAALSPVPSFETTSPGDEAMLSSILSGTVPRRRSARRTRHLRIVGGTGLAVAIIVAAAAFAMSGREETSNVLSSVCYSSASRTPQEIVALNRGANPIDECRRAWDSGQFETQQLRPESLGACINAVDAVVVVPGGVGACDTLGYPIWSGSFSDEDMLVMALQDAISERLMSRCTFRIDFYPELNAIMREFGIEDWDVVELQPWTNEWVCGIVTIQQKTHTIQVAPVSWNTLGPRWPVVAPEG